MRGAAFEGGEGTGASSAGVEAGMLLAAGAALVAALVAYPLLPAAFLTRVVDGRVQQIWMVDALPAYSDEFWS